MLPLTSSMPYAAFGIFGKSRGASGSSSLEKEADLDVKQMGKLYQMSRDYALVHVRRRQSNSEAYG